VEVCVDVTAVAEFAVAVIVAVAGHVAAGEVVGAAAGGGDGVGVVAFEEAELVAAVANLA